MDNVIWDNKFGMVKVEGVGKDAEVVTNQFGGKQSKAPMAMHLIDPTFLNEWFNINKVQDPVIHGISEFMKTGNRSLLLDVAYDLQCLISGKGCNGCEALVTIAKVLQLGAEKYSPNNWRLISQEDNINHALIHYIAYLLGDTQDDHLEHCICRVMMAYATQKSSGFRYDAYVPKKLELVQN